MKTQHFTAGILTIFLLSGYALGQNGWTDDGTVVRLTTSTDNVGIGTSSPIDKTWIQTEGDNNTIHEASF